MKPRGAVASSLAAVLSALAAFSCCLPLAPFLVAAGSAGASALFLSLQPYLVAFAAIMLVFGFVQAFRARQCGRRRLAINVAVLICSTGMVAAMMLSFVPSSAPAGQSAVASLDISSFRNAFNAAADQTRLVVLFSPT